MESRNTDTYSLNTPFLRLEDENNDHGIDVSMDEESIFKRGIALIWIKMNKFDSSLQKSTNFYLPVMI